MWHRDDSSQDAYAESVEPNRERFRKQIGCIDERLPIEELHYVATTRDTAQIAEDEHYTVSRVRWQVFDEVEGEGLLLEPRHNVPITAQIVALPDADWTPETIAGVTDALPPNAQFARRLAKAGCRVVVPLLINRDDTYSGNPTLGAMTNQPHREFIYRMAYQLGRHIIGYEVQKVLSLVDWMSLTELPIGVIGYGEGRPDRPSIVLRLIHAFRRPLSAGISSHGKLCGENRFTGTSGDCYTNSVMLKLRALSHPVH